MLADDCIPLLQANLRRSISSLQDQQGHPSLNGSFQRLGRVLNPNFHHVIRPNNPERINLIRQSASATRHDLISLFTAAARLIWYQKQLTFALETAEEKQAWTTMIREFVAVDIGTIHTQIESLGNHMAKVILNIFDELPGPFTFTNLLAQIETAGIAPLAVGMPLGEAVLSVQEIFRGAGTICHLINTMGAQEYCWTDIEGTIHFQVLDWNEREILRSDGLSLGLPSPIISTGWVRADFYLGSVLGLLVNFLNEVSYNIYNLMASSGLIIPIATLRLEDPDTFEILKEMNISQEDITRVQQAGPGTVTINNTPISSTFLFGIAPTIECIEAALKALEANHDIAS